MKNFFVVVGVLVLLVLGGLVAKAIFYPVNVIDKSLDTANGVIDKSLNSDSAIANYEWFKMQEQSIESLYKKEIRAKKAVEEFKSGLPEDKTKWSRDDKNEYDRLNSIVTGMGNQIDDAIAMYNARSSMVNRSIFKDNLPSNLNRSFFAGLQLMGQ